MRQNNPMFIDILNRFRKACQSIVDVNMINSLCLKTPPNDSTIPHLFYMNKNTTSHNIKVFLSS